MQASKIRSCVLACQRYLRKLSLWKEIWLREDAPPFSFLKSQDTRLPLSYRQLNESNMNIQMATQKRALVLFRLPQEVLNLKC